MTDNNNNKQMIPDSASQFEKLIKGIIGESYDVVIERFKTVKNEAVIVYIDGLINKDILDRDIIYPIKSSEYDGRLRKAIKSVVEEVEDIETTVIRILDGNIAVFQDNEQKVCIVEFRQWEKRAVSTPDAETAIRGPQEGFTESIMTNTALIRRKLKTPNLVFERMVIGRQTNTNIALCYLQGIVNKEVLKELKNRLNKIDTDAILESGHLEQYLEEKPLCLVSGIGMTQKPDRVAARILEGRVAILCDGTPHVLTIPELFMENLQTVEDYSNRTLYANFLRILRVIALGISVLLPGAAVAIMTYNPEMVPFVFLNSFISATERNPLPFALEVFFLIVMFELLKEAGTRLPKTIGSAISIVGALIIGDAAVRAGIVGAPTIIIVALTAVSALVIPNLNEFTTISRFIFLFLGGSMGLIGIGAGIVLLLVSLISADSFGIPILSSFSKQELKDNVLRFPLKKLKFRPRSIVKDNRKRNNFNGES